MDRTHLPPLAILLVSALAFASGSQRPFYVIGHMVNTIGLIDTFLELGSNVLESDVHFQLNGSVKELFHGFPCDKGRVCDDREDLADYLDHVRKLTDPSGKDDGFYGKLVMLFFDLKLGSSGNKTRSGGDMVRHILEHLWTRNGSREQEMRVLLYIDSHENGDFIRGFIDELKNLGLEHRLQDVGFDGGMSDLNQTREMFDNLNYTANVWLGDGITNFFRPFRGDERLVGLVADRDSPSGFIRKVYDWTVDRKTWMRRSLDLGVDGMITNEPKLLLEVLEEPEFAKDFRLATVGDDPFARFVGNV